VWENHLLYCHNPSCPAKTSKKVEHFAKTMRIKGMGPASIAKLNITSIAEIYAFTKEDFCEGLNSNKLGEKLFLEVEKSKTAPLNMLLPALSIPLVGRTAATKLSTVASSIFDINETKCRDAGLGPKVTENLQNWLDNDFFRYADLPLNWKFEIKTAPPTEQLRGVVCISGKLKSFKTKAEAAKVLESLGYEIKSSLTKAVTILINESGIETAKTKKARDSGVIIVENLKEFIGE
jgi:NAD-dependent DNA ligase